MKNEIPVQIYVTKELDEFLKGQAGKVGRTRAGLVRFWLEEKRKEAAETETP